MTALGEFTATTIDGKEQSLSDYSGDVVLVVNTASECGFTPQFAGLEQLWETYRDQGFTIIGFPCNQFGGQDPGTNEEIGDFCQKNYGVTFPMMAKIDVNGEDTHPVWQWLKSEKGGVFGDRIKWNFTKFLVGRDGHVIARYAPQAEPQSLAEEGLIESWSFWAVNEIEQNAVKIVLTYDNALQDTAGGKETLAVCTRLLKRPFEILNQHLASQDYLVGNRFTVADINAAEICRYAMTETALTAPNPHVTAWYNRCHDRPAFKEMWAARALAG